MVSAAQSFTTGEGIFKCLMALISGTFKCLMACSVTSSSFLFQSTLLIRLLHTMPTMAGSDSPAFFISSRVYEMICRVAAAGSAALASLSTALVAQRGAHLLLRLPVGHLLLQLLLQLLASADGQLVAGKVGQLLEAGVREVPGEMLRTPLVGWEQFLSAHSQTGRH